ncbi:MAG: DUF4392 domain-containing protein [Candidatus Verstraetearchaeota archaeon]|nr:DUF4392 domain-containing protein [Candidatus Verstraetearchaeota archaeon]
MKFKDLCEELDKVLRLDVGFRGIVDKLYYAARSLVGSPLVEAAARLISEVEREQVMVVTGFKVLPRMVQETDGPPGVLVLAKTLADLGLEVSLAIEEDSVEVLKAGAEIIDLECQIVSLPINRPLTDYSRELFELRKPALLVFVEKAGANDVGVYHTMFGVDISKYHSRAENLLEEARKIGAKTIAIGDGGNEVGFGAIKDAVRAFVPRGRDCGCPCRGGIAASSKADIIVASSISNVGCYAVSCALSALHRLKWHHDRNTELKLLRAMIDAGAVDGLSGEGIMRVDGVPVEVSASLVDLMSYMTAEHSKRAEGQGYRDEA